MKTVDFSETIAASDLKVYRSRHLIEYMKVCEYWFKQYFISIQEYEQHIYIYIQDI